MFKNIVPKFLLFFLIICAMGLRPSLDAQEKTDLNASIQPELSSDKPIVADQASGELVADGKARLEYGKLLLLADNIRYRKKDGRASAKGNVILTYREFRILADELVYTLANESFTAKQARFGKYPLVGESDALEGSLQGLAKARNATIYWFGPNKFEPNLVIGELEYDQADGVIRMKKGRLRIGNVTLAPISRIKTKRKNESFEARFSAGHDDQLGTSVELGALFDVRPDLRIGGTLEGYSKRGILVGPQFQYGGFGERTASSLDSGFIRDEDPVGLDAQGDELPDDRGFADWSHRQELGEGLTLSAQIEWRRDSEVFRDFRRNAFQRNQWNDTFAELTYSKGNTLASLFARVHPNDFTDQIERKPEIGITLLPTELYETGIYHSLSLGWSSLEEDKADGSANTESDRADLTYRLTRQFSLAKWLSLAPSATYRMARYWDALGASDSLTRHFGEFGLDAKIPFHATFDVQNQLWEVDGLRHQGAFLLQYRYLDDTEDGDRGRVPLLDRRSRIGSRYFDPNLRPLDLREIRYLDEVSDRNLLRVGIENRLQTRAKDYGSRDLGTLRLYQDFIVNPASGEDTLDDFFGELEVKPAHWLSLGLQAKLDADDGELKQLALESRLLDADVSEISLSVLRLEDLSKQYRLVGFRRLDERREIQAGMQFDARTGDVTRATLELFSRISDSWDLVYLLAHRKGTAREDDLQFRLGARILAF